MKKRFMVKPVAIVPLFVSVTPIEIYSGSTKVSVATGFFFTHQNQLYLITNRHVVVNENKEYFPSHIKIRIHTDPNNVKESKCIKINLYNESGIPIWFEHPNLHFDQQGNAIPDIIAVPLELKGRYIIHPFSNSNFPMKDLLLSPGEELIVIGYPLGFYDVVHNLPIVRKAALSSPYGVPFRGNPFFVIDAELHPGTSGSPVLTKPSTTIVTQKGVGIAASPVSFLLGIHSASFEPLKLNIVWYSYLIEEVLLAKHHGKLRCSNKKFNNL